MSDNHGRGPQYDDSNLERAEFTPRKRKPDNAPKFDVDFEEASGLGNHSVRSGLPTDDASRKGLPIFDGVVMYFPLAMAAIAHVSKLGNDQHNPGEPLHWAKEKSTDQRNTQMRHMIDAASGNPFDKDGGRHSAKAAWRALALLETEIEQDGGRLFAEPVQTVEPAATCRALRKYFGTHPCILVAGHPGHRHEDSAGNVWYQEISKACGSQHGEHRCHRPAGHTLPHEDHSGWCWMVDKVSL